MTRGHRVMHSVASQFHSANRFAAWLCRGVDRSADDIGDEVDFGFVDDQCWQEPQHATLPAAAFDDQAAFQGFGLDADGTLATMFGVAHLVAFGAVDDLNAHHQAPASHFADAIRIDRQQLLAESVAHRSGVFAQAIALDDLHRELAS